MRALAAAAASGNPDAVTLVTGIVLAVAAIVSSLTPIVLARRKARKEAAARDASLEAKSGDLTLKAWTTLNQALQEEIRRLQNVQERMQARIDALEDEIEALRKLAISLQLPHPGDPGTPHA